MQVLYREHAAGMYSKMPFAMALCTIEVPYNLVNTFLFSAITYFMVRFILTAGTCSSAYRSFTCRACAAVLLKSFGMLSILTRF